MASRYGRYIRMSTIITGPAEYLLLPGKRRGTIRDIKTPEPESCGRILTQELMLPSKHSTNKRKVLEKNLQISS